MRKYHILRHTTITFCYIDFFHWFFSISTKKCVHYYYWIVWFFHDLCARTIQISDLDRLQADIIIILCKLERIFPHAFFNVTIHLVIHLLHEAKVTSSVGYIPFREVYAYWNSLSETKHVLRGLLHKHMWWMNRGLFVWDILVGLKLDSLKMNEVMITIPMARKLVSLKCSCRRYDH